MSKQKTIYSVLEKECLTLLNWLVKRLEAMEEEGENIGENGKKLKRLFVENQDRIEARSLKRMREAEEWKRIDLTDTDRGLLKESMEAGKKTDEKLVDIQTALLREKFKLLNWGKATVQPKDKSKKK